MNHKKNPIKVKKQKLIERINQAKSLGELKDLEITLSYYPVLKGNYEWDYDYLLDIIEFKLKRMREYFWTHNIVEGEKEYGNICNKLINILHAGYKTNIINSKDLEENEIYVNSKNVHRFFNTKQLSFITTKKRKDKYYLAEIREAKAKALFWKYLHHKIEYFWD